jgi:Tol biopolymer transport system component
VAAHPRANDEVKGESMTRRIPIALAIVSIAAAASFASLTSATPPGANGRIANMRKDAAGHWQTWVAGPRLTGARQITAGPADSGWAVWSPDGKKLAFDSSRTDPNPKDSKTINDIFTMSPDGSDVTKLTDSVGSSGDAAWSPDGSLIAFDADRGDPEHAQGIYVMHADGTSLQRVTSRPPGYQGDVAPRFSPDGSRLVFTRYRGEGASEKAALFVVRLDGSGLRRLTTFAIHAGDADWSPDWARIVFEAYPTPGSYGDVYVIRAAGGGPVDLTRNPVGQAGSADPVWSPDGRLILFLDNRRVNGVGRTGLATMKPNGSGRRFVSGRNIEAHQPDWEAVRPGG